MSDAQRSEVFRVRFLQRDYYTIDPDRNPRAGFRYEGMDAKNLETASVYKRCLEVRGSGNTLIAVICGIQKVITTGTTITFTCSSMDKVAYRGEVDIRGGFTTFSIKTPVTT